MGISSLTDVYSTPWPPLQWQPVYDAYGFYGAWYSGNAERLANIYAAYLSQYGMPFYERIATKDRAALVHVPVAGDLCALSSNLLFSEEPAVSVKFADEDAPSNSEQAANTRLQAILGENAANLLFRSAADTCAAMGGVFLKFNAQPDVSRLPIISMVHADAAYPEFRFGRLTAVDFWTVEEEKQNTIIRRVERYERGFVKTARYTGSSYALGEMTSPEEVTPTGVDALLCEYIPNLLPNRLFRNGVGEHLGRSDFAAVMGLMDSLDEIYTDWLRDIQLAKGRIIGSEEMFRRDTDTGQKYFDIDQQAYLALKGITGSETASLKDQLVLEQFAIRSDEHEKAFLNTMRTIYAMAGYAFTSSGVEANGQAESGTALKTRDRKSFVTRNNKAEIWESKLESLLYKAQLLDKAQFSSGVTPLPVEVHLSDSVDPDPYQLAQTIELLSRAQAASVDTLVRLQHPGWSDKRVQAEIDRIMEERGNLVESPIQGGIA